jgi:hypothetical protein
VGDHEAEQDDGGGFSVVKDRYMMCNSGLALFSARPMSLRPNSDISSALIPRIGLQ